MNPSVHRHKKKLDALFENVETVDDIEMRSEWARYLCVQTSGFVEEAVRSILCEYTEKRAAPPVADYVSSKLDRFTSANKKNISEELTQFKQTWQARFDEELTYSPH